MNDKIVYIGRFCFNNGAPWTRVKNIADLLIKGHNDVYFVSNATQLQDFNSDEHHIVVPYRYKKRSSLINILDLLTAFFEFKIAVQVVEKTSAKIVVLYNETSALSKKMIRYCHKNNITIYADVTEWYEIIPFRYGVADWLFTKSIDNRIRKIDKKLDGVISISPYLREYYNSKGIKTLLVPPIFADINFEISDNNKSCVLSFVYAGSPGTKDLLIPILNAIERINQNDICAIFNLVGVSEDNIKQIWKDCDFKKCGINCYGRQTHEKTIRIVAQSHYTVLLRRGERYAKAGYSTKFAESLLVGTPVICNKVGGADIDIIDGKTGFVLNSFDENELYNLICKLLTYSKEEYTNMQKESIQYSTIRYKSANYVDVINNYLSCSNYDNRDFNKSFVKG